MTKAVKKEEQPKKNKNNKIGIIIAILSIIVILQSVKIFLDHNEKMDLRAQNMQEEADHAATMQELTAVSADLDQRIKELEKLGGDLEELQAAKAEIEKELGDTRKRNRAAISRLQNKLDGYQELLEMKDKEIDKLKALNDQLYSENTELKTEANQLNRTITELSEEQNELEGKIQVASRLNVENFNIVAINSRGREKESPFRDRQVDKLKVEFTIAKNDVAPIEGKDIMLRVLDPKGEVIFDVAKGSGTFFHEGKEQFFTAKQNILFDNSQQRLTFLYEKGSDYESGQYLVEVYTNDYKMGSAGFEVK